jgi:hypothetical protein
VANWDEARQLGVVWPRDRCAYCGERFAPLELVILEDARALVCEDRAACFRRANAGRQMRLPVGGTDDATIRRCVVGMFAVDRAVDHFRRRRREDRMLPPWRTYKPREAA